MTAVRILVVEDESLIRMILAESLEDEGFEVVEAESGDVAARLLDGPNGFRAIVTDIHMPGTTDGIALGRRARSLHPDMPVIYVTGRPDALSAAGTLGPRDAFVSKPYVPSQIVGELRRMVQTD